MIFKAVCALMQLINMSERLQQNPYALEKIEQTEEKKLDAVFIEGRNPATGYEYGLKFLFDTLFDPLRRTPIIKIDTESRPAFLKKGTEREAQDALVDVAQQVRRRSGGFFNIHPYYGAVFGTTLTPVVPGFYADIPGQEQNLKMFIYLSNAGGSFDNRLTQEYRRIRGMREDSRAKSPRLLEYLQASQANPNQQNRDDAIMYRRGEIWHFENSIYNQRTEVPQAMTLTPQNMVALMRGLESDAVLEHVKVSSIHPFRNFP